MIHIPVQGQTRIVEGTGVVEVSTVFATSADDLWEAITEPNRLARWFGEVSPRRGTEDTYEASLVTGWAGTINVTQCERPQLIELTLHDDEPSMTTVRATLEPEGEGTRLTIEEKGLPMENLTPYVAGWHAQIDQLHAMLAGDPTVEWRPRWEELCAESQQS
ncbi:SRPBCC domain-containing protein [Salinibacterium sp. PAMC 21357]|uniref:SRPBCC domain-containing protein n=1 Tax=Salinibacterium sp. PAMC 21357 TaxID=1112215 RepID=UPI00028A2EA0|nr:SRPBCC domain-containing protein [Salinibacterium sp. PAMC 21357]